MKSSSELFISIVIPFSSVAEIIFPKNCKRFIISLLFLYVKPTSIILFISSLKLMINITSLISAGIYYSTVIVASIGIKTNYIPPYIKCHQYGHIISEALPVFDHIVSQLEYTHSSFCLTNSKTFPPDIFSDT